MFMVIQTESNVNQQQFVKLIDLQITNLLSLFFVVSMDDRVALNLRSCFLLIFIAVMNMVAIGGSRFKFCSRKLL